ncbi:MAG: aspartate kinase [Candidatus Krumholzibacteriia bacterium]
MNAPLPPPDRGVVVRKYGGSSLASIDRLRAVARDLVAQRAAGYGLVVVVSAMGRSTDELLHLAHQANPEPPRRELDMLLSVGERITMSLLSMALAAENCPAISYTGSQVGIITDTSHTDARIIEVRADRVRRSLAEGCVVVVAGFQGVSVDREITTLGRGGSDTTAVALAAALGALRCEILKDVDGVFTADPRKVPDARRHATLTYEQMAQVAASGCGVIHARAVEYAERHGVPLLVGSSFVPGPGTRVGPAAAPASAAAAASPAGANGAAWRPLTIDVREDVALLALAGEPADGGAAWARRVAEATGHATILAEWLEQTLTDWRWEAIGDPVALAKLHAGLAPVAAEGGRLRFRRGLACLSLAGPPAAGWTAARAALAPLLAAGGITDWDSRADGGVLRLLVPAAALPGLLAPLHAALLPA